MVSCKYSHPNGLWHLEFWLPKIMKSPHHLPNKILTCFSSKIISRLSLKISVLSFMPSFCYQSWNNSNPSPPSNWQKKHLAKSSPQTKILVKSGKNGENLWELHTKNGCYIERVVLCRTKKRRVRSPAWSKSVKETVCLLDYTNYHGPPKPSCIWGYNF